MILDNGKQVVFVKIDRTQEGSVYKATRLLTTLGLIWSKGYGKRIEGKEYVVYVASYGHTHDETIKLLGWILKHGIVEDEDKEETYGTYENQVKYS